MKLQVFNGGLNLRQAPMLIASNEARECINVDSDSDQLSSCLGLKDTTLGTLVEPYYVKAGDYWVQNNGTKGYLEYQEKLYWADGTEAKKQAGVDGPIHNLGIEEPITIATTVTDTLVPPSFVAHTNTHDRSLSATMVDLSGADPQVVSRLPPGTYEYAGVIQVDGKPWFVDYQTVTPVVHVRVELAFTGSNIIPSGDGPKIYRKYQGVWREVLEGNDDILNISGAASITINPADFLPEQTYHFQAARKVGTRYSELSETLTVTLPVNSWITLAASGAGDVAWYSGGMKIAESNSGDTVSFGRTEQLSSSDYWETTGVDGTVQYLYTYYNEEDGTESQGSPLSTEVELNHGVATVSVMPSSDPQVTHIFLYRIGGNLTRFTKIAELSNTIQSYEDSASGTSLALTEYSSALNGKAPEGLKQLVQAYGVFFGRKGDKLYFTRDIGNPNYWPESYYIDFSEEITGIAVAVNGILVFTKYQTYLISGSNSSTFVKHLFSASQGCINPATIVTQGATTLFLSSDGLCIATGSGIKIVSKFKLGRVTFNAINAVLHDETYYLQLDGEILAFETNYGARFQKYQFDTTWLFVAEDTLYGSHATGAKELFAGEPQQFTYTTGEFTEGSATEVKDYNNIYIAFEGTLSLTVYIDGVEILAKNLVETRLPTSIAVPQLKQRGTRISFKFVGTGKMLELEYKAKGRTNGH